jgi:dipeptidyl aminopeptidase/acylaminoacyl peptidase
MFRRSRALTPLCILLSLFTALAFAAEKRLITEKDLFRFVWIADPQISPDGSRVAFVRVQVNAKKENYDTEIWMVSTRGSDAPIRLTSGPRDRAPRWSPDGSRLLFSRAAERDGKVQPPQLYLLPMSGGEAWPITSLPKGAGGQAWSPDGKTIAFLSSTTPDDIAKEEKKKQEKDSKPEEERESDVRVVTLAVFRLDDEGYNDPKRHSHIWTIAVPESAEQKNQPKQITSGPYDEGQPIWSRDGSQIYFVADRNLEPYYDLPTNVLYSVAASGGEVKKVLGLDGALGDVSIGPDGKQVAFIGAITRPAQSYSQPRLFVSDLKTGAAPRSVAPGFDREAGSGIIGDQHAPRGAGESFPLWAPGGQSIIVAISDQGTSNLQRFDVSTGKNVAVTAGNQEVVDWSSTPDTSKIVVLASSPTNVGDLYLVGENGKLNRLTSVNQELFSELKLTEPEEIWYSSFDGKKIQAWVQKPPDFDPKKKYPLILDIHGGPHAAYGYNFFHEFQWMAAKGYVVLYPNPRGSTTYGQEFGNVIQYHYPGDDAKDLMAGVDELIRRGYIDEHKMGVTGGSGGGVLTNWLIGHTDRFAAAVSQRSIADWSAWWYAADFTLFKAQWFRGAPWEQAEDFHARSPLSYIDKVKTPLMLIEGEADLRTPSASGGEEMFRALKYLKRPVVMVRFPGESHELSRSGGPWHRVERLEHIVNWFDIHLQGKQMDIYKIPGAEAASKAAGD